MSPLACVRLFPEFICTNGNIFAYLLPAVFLAIVFRALARRASIFLVFYLAGTVLHELAHLLAAALTNAQPVSVSILPRRKGRSWILGRVTCANIRWYNAALVGLAPLAVASVPFLVAAWRTRQGLSWHWRDAGIAFLLAPQFISCWPSATDMKVALRSWPLFAAAAGAAWFVIAAR